jgi:hypothetical protein
MSNEEYVLSQEEKEVVISWIAQKKHGPGVCQICGSERWFVADHIVMPLTSDGNGAPKLGGGVGYPFIMLVSAGCGQTLFLSAVAIGLWPLRKKEGS